MASNLRPKVNWMAMRRTDLAGRNTRGERRPRGCTITNEETADWSRGS